MTGPKDPSANVRITKLQLEIDVQADEFLRRYVKFRNLLHDVRGDKLRQRWSRKNMAEMMLEQDIEAIRQQMAGVRQAVGELPSADDDDAMLKYVELVAEWDKQNPPSH